VGELRILLLEDAPSDAELLEHSLRRGGVAFTALRADTETAFQRALEDFKPDIVLAAAALRSTMCNGFFPAFRSSWSPAPSAKRPQ